MKPRACNLHVGIGETVLDIAIRYRKEHLFDYLRNIAAALT
jgi:hypothetical protein